MVSRAENNRHGHTVWNCSCECGKTKQVNVNALRRGLTKSCGCYSVDNPSRRKRPYEALYNALVLKNKNRHDVNLTYDQFLAFTKEDKCGYCRTDISWTSFNVGRNGVAYNLDRMDNALGYQVDNLIVCCSRCNAGKSDLFTHEEWMEAMTFIRQRNTSQE